MDMKDMKTNEGFFEYFAYEKGERNAKQERCLEDVFQAIRVYFQSGIENFCLQELVKSEISINESYAALLKVFSKVCENSEESSIVIIETLNDVVYLSQLKRVLSEYYKERKRREEKEQFKRAQQKYQELYKITDIASKGSVELKVVVETVPIKQRRLKNIINANATLFTMREQKKEMFLSLTPTGKRFHNVVKLPDAIEMQECQKMIYKECSDVLKNITYYIESEKIESRIPQWSGLTMQQNKALEQRYNMVLKSINACKSKSRTTFNIGLKDNFDSYNKILEANYGDGNGKKRIISK